MKRHLHWWVSLLFLLSTAYNLIVWGGAARLDDIGPKLQLSAQRQALLAHMYMGLGSSIDAAVPPLDSWGKRRAEAALSQGFPRIKENPLVAMDLIMSSSWGPAHATLKLMYWLTPVFGVLALLLWARRPKRVHLIGRR